MHDACPAVFLHAGPSFIYVNVIFLKKMHIFNLEYFQIRKMFVYLHQEIETKHKRYGKGTRTQDYERGWKADCSR